MNTTSKSHKQDRVRQLTEAERRALDEEATTCAAEVVGDDSPGTSETSKTRGRGLFGQFKRAASRVASAVTAARRWASERLTPENLDAALLRSKTYAALAAKYGAEVARDAVARKVRQEIEKKINGAVEGPGPARG